MSIIFDDKPERLTCNEHPGFPWIRFDSRMFIWEEALYHGNYVLGSSSAMGRCASRERIVSHLNSFKAKKSHFNAFELEIDGLRLRDRFEFNCQQLAITPEGFEQHITELYYPMKKVTVRVHTLLDGSSFMVRWLEIINKGDKPFAITGCFPLCSMVACEITGNSINLEQNRMEAQVGSFKDNHYLGEGEFLWQEIPKASLVFGHERGTFNPPMYIIRNNHTCEHTVIHIETSMLTQAEFYRGGEYRYARNVSDNDYVHFKAGMDKRSCYNIVKPSESALSPKIHISQIYGDLDSCVNELNIHLRSSVIPKQNNDIIHPVKYNHTGYTNSNQITKKALKDEVDMAAVVGADIFLVDAGWFGAEKKLWAEVVGDWYENPLLENSLSEIFDYARSKGMKCGIWMEIEGIKFTSTLAQEHPDWFCSAYNTRLPVLNILKPEVENFIYNTIVATIEKYKLECFRIDGGLKEPIDDYKDDYIECMSWKYFDKLHRVYERVYEKFPYLYMENCSGGGGRSDQAFLRRFHWLQLTDLFAPVSQLRVLYGMSLALAPEQCYTICGASMLWPAQPDFVSRVGFFGQMGICGIAPQIDKASPECIKSWSHTVELYKKEMRPILSTCNVYHHTPLENYMERGQWVVLEYAAHDTSKSIIGVFRLEGANEDVYLLQPKGIAPGKNYEIYFDNTRETVIVSGWELQNHGIRVLVKSKLMSELVIISNKESLI